MDLDVRVRVAAFNFLAEQTRLLGEVLPRASRACRLASEGRQVQYVPYVGVI